jgi:hypothetical protein
MKHLLLLLTTALLLSSCNITTGLSKKSRAQKMVDKAVRLNPDLLQTQEIRIDTLIITKAQIERDTFTLKEYDTIQNTINGIEYKIIRQVDTFHVQIECPPDTVQVEVIRKVAQVKHIPANWWQRNNWWIFLIILILVILYVVISFSGYPGKFGFKFLKTKY